MVDSALAARKVAAIRDAALRVRNVLPDLATFREDRTAREVVTLNLFVALQECLALATHWIADEGWTVPESYRDVFAALAERGGVIPPDLGQRLGAAAGLRNLIAHQYGVLDWSRIHEIASTQIGDLLVFADILANRAGEDR